MIRTPQECWEKVDKLIELDEAIKQVTYYIDQYPVKYDIDHWIKVRKRLKNRKRYLEKFVYEGNLNLETWYNEERVRNSMIEYLNKQGVRRK